MVHSVFLIVMFLTICPFDFILFFWIRIYFQHYLGKGPHQAKAKKIYNELRDNLIHNIYNEYERSGYVWEQYNDKTGHGQRSHPFTGWTSMVVLLMQMGRAE